MSKKGLSAVVTLMLLVLIVMASAGILWFFIEKTVNENLDSAGSCYDLIGKLTLNNDYTCYNSTSSEFSFSINREDLELEKIIISISDGENSESFTLTENPQTIANLRNYNGTAEVYMPNKNSGLSYIASTGGFSPRPTKVEIAPVINGNLCSVADSISNVYEC